MQETSSSDQFDDIRPYTDAEVRPVLKRLLHDPAFITAIYKLRCGRWPWAPASLVKPLVAAWLRFTLRNVHTVEDLQLQHVARLMNAMIRDTTDGFSVSGIEHLHPSKNYLFISNHRDIALDPAFVNYTLAANGMNTLRIAIGDNLLTQPFASDLMRLNKSFIVKRSAKGPRQMLQASKQLSAYIRHSITADNSNIWLAQREGRAKDGCDITEPAIIKMLSLSRSSRSETLPDSVRILRIVPVAIAYEYDPCDSAKARELAIKAAGETYEKAAQEDVASIATGITGYKGRVHVALGPQLQGEFDTPDAVAAAIDAHIIKCYRLQATNCLAYLHQQGDSEALQALFTAEGVDRARLETQRPVFNARVAALPAAQQPFMVAMYARIVARKLQQAVSA